MIGVGSSGSPRRGAIWALGLLAADRFALVSAIFLILMILAAAIGPELLVDTGTRMNLQMRNAPPFSLEHGFAYLLGGDALGRPILPRLLVAARTTLLITLAVVACSMVLGALLGLVAGYFGRRIDSLIMRIADVVMSFPSLLLAVIVLYVLEPRVGNVVIVLAITRTPVYIRVARAEVLEVRERLFIDGARAAGASDLRIMALHIAPIVLPTIFTVATLDFANVMLAESALSFLGIGVQPPGVTWGLMVATGRNYLTTAWWLAFWPGLAILLTALAANLLSNWLRIAMDPKLRWRLEQVREEKRRG
jgi:peptide/nickel transport system permease protein